VFGLPSLPRNLEASFRDLESKKAEVRASAIADVVRHARSGDDVRARALPLLERALSDEAPMVRRAACVALGELDAVSVLPKLLVAMEDSDDVTRQMAINAVGELEDARALPRLRRALGDGRPDVRYQAVIAFVRVCDDADECDDALTRALGDADDAVAHIALRVAEERADGGKPPSPRLIAKAATLLDATHVSVRLAAAILLCKAGDPRGRELVARAVRGALLGAEKEDEAAAVELAGELGLEELRPHLERRAWGLRRLFADTCAFSARIALARLGDARARDAILADLDAVKPELRAAAVVAVGRANIEQGRDLISRMTAASVDPSLVQEALARMEKNQEEKAP
jgi:HEAT repeat protein